MSRRSSAIHSPDRRPVAAANITSAPLHSPSLEATEASCAHDSNGRFSVRRRCGLSTPCLAGLTSIIPQATARASTCRSAWVASKRCPVAIVIRQAAISCERSSPRRRSPNSETAFASSQRSFSIVSRLRVMLGEVLIDEPGERKRGCGAVRTPQPLKRPIERLPRVQLRLKAAPLHPPRAPPTRPIPEPPKRRPARPVRLHREDLTLLRHDEPPRSTTRSRNQTALELVTTPLSQGWSFGNSSESTLGHTRDHPLRSLPRPLERKVFRRCRSRSSGRREVEDLRRSKSLRQVCC